MPRIVSLIASATEIVCALGFEDDLVGRSHECDYPPAARRLPAVSRPTFPTAGSSRSIDLAVKERLAVTRMIERRYGGDRPRALHDLTRRVARALGVAGVPQRLAPVVALIPDLVRWPLADRRGLARLLRIKEGRRERPYAVGLLGARRLYSFLRLRYSVGAS